MPRFSPHGCPSSQHQPSLARSRRTESLGHVAYVRVVLFELVPDEATQIILCDRICLDGEVEDFGGGLVVDVVQRPEILVLQRIGGGYPLVRVEDEHLLEQIDGLRVGVRVQGGEGDLGLLGERLDVLDCLRVLNDREIGRTRLAESLDDEPQLLQVVLAGEQRLAAEALGEDAAHRPDVDALVVGGVLDQQLRCAVPARDYIFRKLLRDGIVHTTGQPEIANFEVAILVDEQVVRLQVAMEHLGRVDGFEAAQDLVNEVLDVVVGERLLGVDDVVQVSVHQLENKVNVLPLINLARRRQHDVAQVEDVLMREVLQQLHFA
mmetsp:Transcript_39239/g.103439  ORF Transcript_39239/g.103439 Transcript_39239/m.103439 type:complete len:321 (-) Transcript_39239:246-1208(-)